MVGPRARPWPSTVNAVQPRPGLVAVVAGGAVFNGLLAIPIKSPRIFGDELIYWQLSRSLAWAGEFTVRGEPAPRYGVVYPALLAVAQRLGGEQTTAYAIAQGLNAVLFSLTAIPVYLIASRVLRRRYALLAGLLAVVLPSCIYTSTIMTENAFYPLFCTCRAAHGARARAPVGGEAAAGRRLGGGGVPRSRSRGRAASVVSARGDPLGREHEPRRKDVGARACLRQHAPTIAVLAVAGVVAGAVVDARHSARITSSSPRTVSVRSSTGDSRTWPTSSCTSASSRWRRSASCSSQALSSASLSAELRRLVLLTACLGAGMLATVAALSASPYGLGRAHERNLFYLAPLVLISFFAWLEAGLPRPRDTRTAVAVALVLLPLSIPARRRRDVGRGRNRLRRCGRTWGSGRCRRSTGWCWSQPSPWPCSSCRGERAVMLGAASSPSPSRSSPGSVTRSTASRPSARSGGTSAGSIAPSARMPGSSHSGRRRRATQYSRIEGLWSDEFYNRSVRDVASARRPAPGRSAGGER